MSLETCRRFLLSTADHLTGVREEARGLTCVADIAADLEFISVMHRKSDEERIDFFFTAGSWGGEIVNREPRKCDELAWFPLDDFPEYMVSYVRRALMNHRDGRWFDSFGWT